MIIRSIDFETTGFITDAEPDHKIIEIGWADVNDLAVIQDGGSVLCNPGRPISHEAMAVHHITDAMVSDAHGEISILGTPTYFCAHVADHELKYFKPEVPIICTYKAALRLWPDAPAHNLQFLRYHLALEVDPERVSPPHRAGPDAYLGAVLMLRILKDGRATIDEMVRWSGGPALLPKVNFGKHKGKKWEELPTDYLEWIIYKSDMDRDIIANAKHHLKKRLPT